MNALLSIIMPTYNGEKFIAFSLESVRAQNDPDIEVIVVDDGSRDRTLEIVQSFASQLPIRILTPGRIGNWTAVTNIGLRAATGEWGCFLHQDDYWLPGRIARLRTEMSIAEGSLILHNAVFVGPTGQSLGRWTCPLSEGTVTSDRFIERLLIQNFIAIPSPAFRMKDIGDGLDESLWFSADWDFWLRLGARGPARFINETLAAFRIHPGSQTAAKNVKDGEWKQQLSSVLNRHLPTDRRNTMVHKAAMASVAVNSALSAKSRGQSTAIRPVCLSLLKLGPLGWFRYTRDSRIFQRVIPRLRLGHQ